jgi:hypothetical protein
MYILTSLFTSPLYLPQTPTTHASCTTPRHATLGCASAPSISCCLTWRAKGLAAPFLPPKAWQAPFQAGSRPEARLPHSTLPQRALNRFQCSVGAIRHALNSAAVQPVQHGPGRLDAGCAAPLTAAAGPSTAALYPAHPSCQAPGPLLARSRCCQDLGGLRSDVATHVHTCALRPAPCALRPAPAQRSGGASYCASVLTPTAMLATWRVGGGGEGVGKRDAVPATGGAHHSTHSSCICVRAQPAAGGLAVAACHQPAGGGRAAQPGAAAPASP